MPANINPFVAAACGYKFFAFVFGNTAVGLGLRATTSAVIELHSIIAYPDRKGGGTVVIQRLCDLADELGVTLWLDAFPFGANRTHIPLPKLKSYYRSFDFFTVRQVNPKWVTAHHRLTQATFKNLMMRNPRTRSRP